MAGYFTDKNKKLHQFAGGDNLTKYCLPVGTIFPSAIPLTDASVHLLDGSTISQTGVYQEFAELVKSLVNAGYNISCSQSDFDSAVSSTGNCGKFVIDNTSNTIRLPKITQFIQGLSNMIDIGKSFEAGLPNIEGHFAGRPYGGTTQGALTNQVSGAFSYTLQGITGTDYSPVAIGSGGAGADKVSFNANNGATTKGIYGNSDTVQPQATSFPYYIVLTNGFVSDVKLDIDNFINDLNNKLSKTDIVRYATEKYISSDGLTTYTIYNDGWKECSGFITRSNNSPVTLPVTFSNTNYKIFLTAQTRNTTILAISYESKTSNSFVARMDSWTGTFNYYCCGY